MKLAGYVRCLVKTCIRENDREPLAAAGRHPLRSQQGFGGLELQPGEHLRGQITPEYSLEIRGFVHRAQ